MDLHAPVPILRMFDEAKARAFYVDYLGFAVDWEHRFDPDAPLYMQVSRGDCVMHLSEHHGDGTPGTYLRVRVSDVRKLHAQITAKPYKYMRPGIQEQDYGEREVVVYDPFGNRLIFCEPMDES